MSDTPRIWKAEGFFPFRVEVLTPVFIGSGETLSPLEYVIRKEGDNYYVWLVNVGAWLAEYAHDAEVQGIINTDDVKRIRALFQEKIDVQLYGLCKSAINTSLAQRFEKDMQSRGGKTLEIDAFLRNPLLKNLILPGSSLKGALSTPIIDGQDSLLAKLRIAGKPTLKENYNTALRNMFGNIGEHAMQALKVTDMSIPASHCHIVSANECSEKEKKSYTPKNPCEVIPQGTAFYTSFSLDCSTGKPAIDLKKYGGNVYNFDVIREKCNAFYKERFDKEMKQFYMQPHLTHIRQGIAHVQMRIEEALRSDASVLPLLVRMGRYSHVECMTVTHNAPKGRSFKGGKAVFGKTRTLANGKLPFGWVLLHPCPQEEHLEGIKNVEEKINQEFFIMSNLLAAQKALQEEQVKIHAQEQKAKEEAKRKLEEEAQQRAAAAAAEEERLAQLSPEERKIAELALSSATENTAKELLDALDNWESDLQYKAAQALKDYWHGMQKWSGKMSDKQKKKVQKVQKILDSKG